MSLKTKAAKIQLLILDVDGVLTNGQLVWTDGPSQAKSFNVRDGFGIRQLAKEGVTIAVITGRESKAVKARTAELHIEHVFQNCPDKLPVFEKLIADLNITPEQTAFVGDDLIDLPVMTRAGLGVAVHDAYPFVAKHADYVTKHLGGFGAVREVCDLILDAKGLLDKICHQFLEDGSELPGYQRSI